MTDETILTNARIVTETDIVDGTLVLREGRIAELGVGNSAVASAVDCEGDWLIPGLIELHTDNLDKHAAPRPKVHWPAVSAVVAHDAQIATAGITTVFDAVSIGEVHQGGDRLATLHAMLDGLETCRVHAMLRAEHFVHLRCEISRGEVAEQLTTLVDRPGVRLLSLMDHTPGQRQFTSQAQYESYYKNKYSLTDAELEQFVTRALHDRAVHGERCRRLAIEMAQARGLRLASHDDATPAHAKEAAEAGAVLGEFPTTRAATEALRAHGLQTLFGAPNIVRGGSHSGNVAAVEMATAGLLDILSSDYVPASLLPAAFQVCRTLGWELPAAISLVSANPADAMGLADRGRIAPGLRADVVRVAERAGLPLPRAVWRQGERVA
jgi:alpha-D-ribose 1-methylphosphonate 5-triphosphate diphosphatase